MGKKHSKKFADYWPEMEQYLIGLNLPNTITYQEVGQLLFDSKLFPFEVQILRRHRLVKQFVDTLQGSDGTYVEDGADSLVSDKTPTSIQKIAHTETKYTESEGKATFEGSYRATDFSSPEAYMESKGVDFGKWQVKEVKLTSWNGFYKDKNKEAQTVLMHSCSATLQPRLLNEDKFWADTIEKMKAHAPLYKSIKRVAVEDGCLLAFNAFDVHFGKLVWAAVSGDTYNLGIARERVLEAAREILALARAAFGLEKILLFWGHDMQHVDSGKNETANGTRQDVTGLWEQAYEVCRDTWIEVIEMFALVADVELMYIRSNHSPKSDYHLFDALRCWFRHSKNISFDGSPAPRKYKEFGLNLIGSTHGDEEKTNDLPALMAIEQPEMWGRTKFHYWYTGHVHHKNNTRANMAKDYIGATVESMRSPTPPDRWHKGKGYIGTPKAIEGFVHSKTRGVRARFTHIFSQA